MVALCRCLWLGWSLQVDELLPKGVDSIPQLSVALVTISKALDSEMSNMPAHEVSFAACAGGSGAVAEHCSVL
jgi:hypothetical protein